MKTFILSMAGLILCLTPVMSAVKAEAPKKNRIVVVSFDGMRQDLTKKYVNEGKLPHIKALIESGVWAKKPSTITPSLTAPSHAAISTGATPKKTGVVSNQWHDPEKAFQNKDDAFHTKVEVPPIWAEARQQGKITAAVAFPGANPDDGNKADYSIYYGETWSPSSLEALVFKAATDWTNSPKSFSPLKETVIPLKIEKEKNKVIHMLAIDTKDDKERKYDTFILSEDKKISETDAVTEGNKWGSLSMQVNDGETAGFSFKLKADEPDLKKAVPFYKTAVTSGLISGPSGFKKEITDQFGFFPVQDDDKALQKKWITREEYEEISARFVTWITDVSLYIKETYEPELLMFHAPQIDHEEHQYLLTDPRQPGYSAEKSEQYLDYVEWAYLLADDVVGRTMGTMEANDHLFVLSDHGMEPAHSVLEPNKRLKDAGLLSVDDKGKIDYMKTKAYAIPSGSTAHVYINLASREKNGIVSEEEYEDVQKEVIQLFKETTVERTGRDKLIEYTLEAMLNENKEALRLMLPEENREEIWKGIVEKTIHPYKTVLAISEEHKKPLGHAHSGDILLIGAPGYMMGNGTSYTVKPAIELGTHGGDSTNSVLRPVFMATGLTIKQGKTIEEMSTLDIAPTLYELLGVEAPLFVENKHRIELWRE